MKACPADHTWRILIKLKLASAAPLLLTFELDSAYLCALMEIDLLIKIGAFIIVGAVSFGVDAGISYSLLKKLGWPLVIANSIGFIIGKAINFYANRELTFQSDDPNILRQIIYFAVIVLVGLVIVNIIVKYLHDSRKWRFFPAKLTAMAVIMVYNFIANDYLTFAR